MVDTLQLQVSGMDCAACEKRLATALGRLDGVAEVAADHHTGAVQVNLSAPADRATVIERLEAAGFTLAAGEEGAHR